MVLGLVAVVTLAGALAVSAGGPGRGSAATSQSSQEAIAKALNMTVEDLRADLKDGKTIADLAQEKGVSLQSLKDASDAAQKTAVRASIEKSVTDGDITRAQADWMLQGLDKGFTTSGMGHTLFGSLRGFGKGTPDTGMEAAAQALGMTSDELSLQMWGGKTLSGLAKDKGVELQKVQDAIEAARKAAQTAAIEAAVKAGTLTREQADWMLKGLEQGYTEGRGMPGAGFDMGPGGMQGGRGGRGGQAPAPRSGTSNGTSLPGRAVGAGQAA